MVDVVIIGTIGLDDVKTPFGEVKNVLGGSATYAATAASFFSKPGIVSIVGDDFPKENYDFFKKKNICAKGIEKKGKTFRWEGLYEYDMNEAKTLRTELNALEFFNPKLPEEYKNAKYVFLANVSPSLQKNALMQIKKPKFVVMDTMNFWIKNEKNALIGTIKMADVLLLNDGEARQLFETVNLCAAANKALELGVKHVIIKKGEHGALLFSKNHDSCDNNCKKTLHFNAPGYPLEVVKDPTGCGDCFAGAFIGYLAKTDDINERNLRKAIIYGSVIASYNAEDFSLNKLKKISHDDIENRYKEFMNMREF